MPRRGRDRCRGGELSRRAQRRDHQAVSLPLSQPARLGELLRRLHELGVLEKILPDFTHARCVCNSTSITSTPSTSTILAVERATQFFSHPGIVGRVYRGIKQKRILHLALLIHDLGKGYVEDHSESGCKIADDTAERLGLPTVRG